MLQVSSIQPVDNIKVLNAAPCPVALFFSPTMSARVIGFLLAVSSFVILQAHAAAENHHATHATHTAKQYAAHQTGHHTSVAHKGKQFLKLVLGIVIGNVHVLIK